jgi:glycosyltransferase involved in cell wall biosynthesis
MKIFTDGWIHHKNKIGVELLSKVGFSFDGTYDHSVKYDQIHIFDKIKRMEAQDCIHIYGPHFYHLDMPHYDFSENEYMNCLSKWVKDLTNVIRPDVRCVALPFPVDVDRFTPKQKTGKPVLYFKTRDLSLLEEAKEYFKETVSYFNYDTTYKESDYIEAIQKAPYCIWLGRHESQGFAFQEAMSCNCPIFVIDVRSLREEAGSTWKNFMPGQELKGTAASYFDDTCGLITYPEKWQKDIDVFMSNIKNYSPRQFVLHNLSPKVCAEKWRSVC